MSNDLLLKRQSAWETCNDSQKEEAFQLAEHYKVFMNRAKTERETVQEVTKRLSEQGFVELAAMKEQHGALKPGDKIYKVIKGKSVVAAVIGADLAKGFNIVAPHIDSPRLELKPHSMYEEFGLVLAKAFQPVGIKPFHWVTIPLALHGFFVNKDGEEVQFIIGEAEDDPVFYISDLALHVSHKQRETKVNEALTSDDLNVIIAGMPSLDGEVKDRFKWNLLVHLYEKYGVRERDLVCAEVHVVPQFKARDVGMDRSMVAAFGQDDRSCTFLTLQALLELDHTDKTCIGMFLDKEEHGSMGNTGAKSRVFENVLMEIYTLINGEYNELDFRLLLEKSFAISADVTGLTEPLDPSVSDLRNSAYIGQGACMDRYLGLSNSEYISRLTHLFDKHEVAWQSTILHKDTVLAGASVACSFAHMGMEAVNLGPGISAMHSPYELSSKIDLYMTYRAYKVFFEAFE